MTEMILTMGKAPYMRNNVPITATNAIPPEIQPFKMRYLGIMSARCALDQGGADHERSEDFSSRAPPRNELVRLQVYPPNPKKSPSGEGSVGVNGTKSNALLVSKPAAAAAAGSANGVSAATAWLISVHFRVRS
jgi:hypothetical protein